MKMILTQILAQTRGTATSLSSEARVSRKGTLSTHLRGSFPSVSSSALTVLLTAVPEMMPLEKALGEVPSCCLAVICPRWSPGLYISIRGEERGKPHTEHLQKLRKQPFVRRANEEPWDLAQIVKLPGKPPLLGS